jgi:biopolymer transport protein ExbB
MDLFLFYMNAGGPVMWVILCLSVLGSAIIFERVLFFAAARREVLFSGDNGNVSDVEALRLLADRRVQAELFRWRRNLALLEIIIRAAPMLGLLGTVLGMVEMFRVLGAGGNIDSAAVVGGIREALFTTVAGLCCAVPLLFADGLLNAAIDNREERLNEAADQWIRERIGNA